MRERWKEGKGKAKEKYYEGINIKQPKFEKHTLFLPPKSNLIYTDMEGDLKR